MALESGRHMRVSGVVLRCLVAMVIGLALVVSGCTTTQPSFGDAPLDAPPVGAPPASNEGVPLPVTCVEQITEPEQARAALAQLQPGSRVCLSGEGLADAELKVATSGTAQRPITIVGDRATLRSVDVRADHVVIEGLTLRDGDGLTMAGRGLAARNNVIDNAAQNGLVCQECVESVIESNTVRGADGTGIYLVGQRITVQNNTVSGSVARTQNDADGIRFFGIGHRLIGNTIRDIKASGYRDEGPHTDCFQTYDTDQGPPTYDVVIANNVCTNVDVQCMIATIDDRRAPRGPKGQSAIIFENNTCEVNGSQAVLLRNFSDVLVRGNRFSGPGDRAVQLDGASNGVAVVDNTVTGRMRPFEIDPRSAPGFQESGNSSR